MPTNTATALAATVNMTISDKEQRIMLVMRKVLTSVIKDATPQPGEPHPLSQETLDDIRECLKLIAVREQELNTGTKMAPKFADESNSKVIPISTVKKDKN